MTTRDSLIKTLKEKIKELETYDSNTLFNYDIQFKEKPKCPRCGSYEYEISSFMGFSSGACKNCMYEFFED